VERLKVSVLFEQHRGSAGACSYVRLLRPLTHPSIADAVDVRPCRKVEEVDGPIAVVERTWRGGACPAMAEDAVHGIRRTGACLVYTIDDNLLDLEWMPARHKEAVRCFARAADAVIVSTEPLRRRMQHLNANIYVVPTALDARLFAAALTRPARREARRPRVVGYMGTYTHDADVMMILESLRAALRRRRNDWELQLVGGVTEPTLCALRGLPVRVLKVGWGKRAYPRFVPWLTERARFDLAVAPLEASVFTRCKSDLKFLEYSALGIPAIYSRVTPYKESVRHLETGYLAENTPRAWTRALEQMMDDEAGRREMAERAQDHVRATRTLAVCAVQWCQALGDIQGRFFARRRPKEAA